MDTNLIHNFYI